MKLFVSYLYDQKVRKTLPISEIQKYIFLSSKKYFGFVQTKILFNSFIRLHTTFHSIMRLTLCIIQNQSINQKLCPSLQKMWVNFKALSSYVQN